MRWRATTGRRGHETYFLTGTERARPKDRAHGAGAGSSAQAVLRRNRGQVQEDLGRTWGSATTLHPHHRRRPPRCRGSHVASAFLPTATSSLADYDAMYLRGARAGRPRKTCGGGRQKNCAPHAPSAGERVREQNYFFRLSSTQTSCSRCTSGPVSSARVAQERVTEFVKTGCATVDLAQPRSSGASPCPTTRSTSCTCGSTP